MRKAGFTALTIAILLNAGCAYFNTFYNARLYYGRASRATERNQTDKLDNEEQTNYQKAVDKALLLLENFPNSKWADDALFLLGKSYFHLRDYTLAERRLNELISEYPGSPFVADAKFTLARTKVATERFREAESDFANLLRQNLSKKKIAEIIYHQAKLYERERDFAKAIETYADVLKADAQTWGTRVWYAVGNAYDTLGVFDKASDAYRQVLKFNPTAEAEFESQFRLARSEKNQGRLDEAIKMLERLQGDEKYKARVPQLRLETADCLNRKGDVNGAMLTYQDVVQSNPNTDAAAEAYWWISNIYETERRDYDRAVDGYSQVRKQSARSPFADSADVKGRDILRLQALVKVVGMALRGEKGEGVEVGSMAQEDTLNRVKTDTLPSVQPSDPVRAATANETGPGMGSVPATGLNPDKPPAIAENPELKSFNKDELDKNLFLLGELYMFRFALPDSALGCFGLLTQRFPKSSYTPQALYNMGYLYDTVARDSAGADSCYRILYRGFPDTPQARGVLKRLRIERVFTAEDSAWNAFTEAERSYWSNSDPNAAVKQYAALRGRFPKTQAAPKALYSEGWLYEHALDSLERAAAAYDSLVTRYPSSPYAAKVKTKLDLYKMEKSKPVPAAAPDILQPVKTTEPVRDATADSTMVRGPLETSPEEPELRPGGLRPDGLRPDGLRPDGLRQQDLRQQGLRQQGLRPQKPDSAKSQAKPDSVKKIDLLR